MPVSTTPFRFRGRISYNPGCRQTLYVVEDDLELLILLFPLSAGVIDMTVPRLYGAGGGARGFIHGRSMPYQLSPSHSGVHGRFLAQPPRVEKKASAGVG